MPRSTRSDVSWSSTFNTIKAHLRREVFAARNVPLFAAAQDRQPDLAPYSGIEAVLGVLTDDSGTSATTREGVVRALLEEYQQGSATFWAGVLILSFLPLLGAVRMRLSDSGIPDDELTSMLLTTFLDTASGLDVGHGARLTALRLRQQTARRVFEAINSERNQRDFDQAFGAALHVSLEDEDREWMGCPRAFEDPEVTELAVGLLHRWVGSRLDPAYLDLVAETVVRGVRLWDYLDSIYPDLPLAARIRTYQRLKRQRTRALERLRVLLAGRRVPK